MSVMKFPKPINNSKPRLGHILYANSLPVYEAIFSNRVPINAEIISAHPAKLNEMIINGELDISPVSSITYANHQSQLKLLNGLCINSLGAVYSVIIAGNTPIESWNGKTIGLTENSATAAAVTKILLQNHYKLSCRFQVVPFEKCGKLEGVAAELIIGDAAFLYKDKFTYCYDLASLWLEITNQAIVFAVWVVRSDFANKNPQKVAEIEKSLLVSYHKSDRQNVLVKAKEKLNLSDQELNQYFKALGYDFNNNMQNSLLYFYQRAAEAQIAPACPYLGFWDRASK